jgi:hypothetical protein
LNPINAEDVVLHSLLRILLNSTTCFVFLLEGLKLSTSNAINAEDVVLQIIFIGLFVRGVVLQITFSAEDFHPPSRSKQQTCYAKWV